MSGPKLQLPAAIADLELLACNLRWSWHRPTRALFRWLDPELWMRSRRNPILLLAEIRPERLIEAAADAAYVERVGEAATGLRAYLADRGARAGAAEPRRIAYFSAEFAIAECIRVFSGGLGVLAGDHLKSASDLGLPLVGIGLLYKDGYFTQQVDREGWQHETYRHLEPDVLPLTEQLGPGGEPLRIRIPFPGRSVFTRVWRADVGAIPLYLLDTDAEGNVAEDRQITDRLYGGDLEHRLKQELILGIGGVRTLEALGHPIEVFHLNEGHAAFAIVERLSPELQLHGSDADAALAATAGETVFTTHTPVEAGHDYFPADLMRRYFGPFTEATGLAWDWFLALGESPEPARRGQFCMTALALRGSRAANGVSRLHGRVSREMWRKLWGLAAEADTPIGHITNGVHLPTWVGPVMGRLYSQYVDPEWAERSGGVDWAKVGSAPPDRIWAARQEQRARLIDRLRGTVAVQARARGESADDAWTKLDGDAPTIAFARRFATYKRATLLLSDVGRLARIVSNPDRPVQIVFAGKAHPRDDGGKKFVHEVFELGRRPEFHGRLMFIENYDVELARYLTRGADVWLNVPRRPYEASGTSGMKAAANGGLNLSIADGWWAEAWDQHNAWQDAIGWRIDGEGHEGMAQDAHDAASLYDILENQVLPLFYERDADGVPVAWIRRVQASIAQLCPFFNTDRMVTEYAESLYHTAPAAVAPAGGG
jgi:starch phosphorylase